jgi:cytoskeletal protein CcmA (bactofilin family)
LKLKWNLKLRSGALQFTVFVAVLIALLLSALILYAYTFIYMKEQSKGAIENIQLSEIGIEHLLDQQEFNGDTLHIDFIKNENQSVKVHLSPWGVFEKAFVVSQFRKKIFKKIGIIGSLVNSEESPTLFLQETQNPLTVVGKTKIKGNVFLPTQGIKAGYIAGNSYYGSQLVYGSTKKSTSGLPKLNPTTIESLVFDLKAYKPLKAEDYINLETNQRIAVSFKENTKGSYSKNTIVLQNREITGNVIIKSDTLIRVKNTAFLKDIILIAPNVEIEDGVVGNFQVIASRRITVGKMCKLNYPSALALYQDNKTSPSLLSNNVFENKIFIDSGSTIRGSVLYFQTKEKSDFQTQIVLEKEARIKGQVYCNGNFELKGTVSGSVYIKQFIANQAGSIFVNHIYDGVIENENIPIIFGGVIIENEPKTIMKWLY